MCVRESQIIEDALERLAPWCSTTTSRNEEENHTIIRPSTPIIHLITNVLKSSNSLSRPLSATCKVLSLDDNTALISFVVVVFDDDSLAAT